MKTLIRSLSVPTEVCLILLLSCGLTIAVTFVWIINHVWQPVSVPSPAHEAMHMQNGGIVFAAIKDSLGLAIILWIGHIRGWSFKTFGFNISWKWTGAGVLLFAATKTADQIMGLLTTRVFHGTVDYHRDIHLTLPFVLLITAINPFCEEFIESGYVFHVLQRHGMWVTVLVAALFRGFLHATMGYSGFIAMFVMGLLYGFFYWRWRQLWPLILAHALGMLYALLPKALGL